MPPCVKCAKFLKEFCLALDEGTKLLACSGWILGYATAMSVEDPLYKLTGKSFCNLLDYLNGLAFIQNWVGGFGIAFLRAIYIQNPWIFPMQERRVVFLLGVKTTLLIDINLTLLTLLTSTLGFNYLWYVIYTPTYPDFKSICLGRPMDDPLLHYNALDTLSVNEFHLILSLLTFITSSMLLLEMSLYVSTFKFLVAHDKMARVKLGLSDSTMKKRMKRNAIDLSGHAMIFAVDGCWLIIKVIENWSVKGVSPTLLRNRRWAFKGIGMCMYGIISVIHIGFSSSLREKAIAIFKPLFKPLIGVWKSCLKQRKGNSVSIE